MSGLFASGGITLLYLALVAVGVIYAVIVLIGGGLEGLGGADVDVDLDMGGFKFPAVSPVAIASFVTAFGAFGLFSIGLWEASARASLAWAAGGGLGVAVLAQLTFSFFLIRPQGSSEVRLSDIAGSEAEVITPIPASGVGEVALVAQGGRLTYTARSGTGQAIARGTAVVVEKIVGGVAVVRPA